MTFKVRNDLQAMITALDNYEHGRKGIDYLEGVFERRVTDIQKAIEKEKQSKEAREE